VQIVHLNCHEILATNGENEYVGEIAVCGSAGHLQMLQYHSNPIDVIKVLFCTAQSMFPSLNIADRMLLPTETAEPPFVQHSTPILLAWLLTSLALYLQSTQVDLDGI
jgi:hypothetical protein